jgi:hypothetical protein
MSLMDINMNLQQRRTGFLTSLLCFHFVQNRLKGGAGRVPFEGGRLLQMLHLLLQE